MKSPNKYEDFIQIIIIILLFEYIWVIPNQFEHIIKCPAAECIQRKFEEKEPFPVEAHRAVVPDNSKKDPQKCKHEY